MKKFTLISPCERCGKDQVLSGSIWDASYVQYVTNNGSMNKWMEEAGVLCRDSASKLMICRSCQQEVIQFNDKIHKLTARFMANEVTLKDATIQAPIQEPDND